MQLSCGMAPGSRALEYARLAESLGYRRIWLYDSPGAVHDAQLVGLTQRDRRHLDPGLMAFALTGMRAELRTRCAELEASGVTELIYAPMGPDVPRELRAMAEVLA